MLEILEVLNGENSLENVIESLRLFAQYDLHRWFLEISIMFEVTHIAVLLSNTFLIRKQQSRISSTFIDGDKSKNLSCISK